MFAKLFRLMVVMMATVLGANLAQATGISYQGVPGGVHITLTNVDAPDGPPPAGALHCLMGTRQNYALSPDGRIAHLRRMIGGCVNPNGENATHVVLNGAVNSQGVLCLIPIWADPSGRFLAWSAHPNGPTQQTARRGGMITALVPLSNGGWRAATAAEAYTCD